MTRISPPVPDPTPAQRGIALITVLLLLVFVLTIVGSLFYRHQIHLQKATRSILGEQALLLLLGAESWVQARLLEDARHSSIDSLDEGWARRLPPLPVEGGVLAGCVIDLNRRINLNNLAWYTNKSWADELATDYRQMPRTTRRTLVRDLLANLGLDAGDHRIAALVDWVDSDAWLVSPESAEDNEYLLLDPPYRPANHPLVDTAEIALVQGFSGADALALEPYAATVAEDMPVNVNTAPLPVLVALSPLVSVEDARRLAARRPFPSLADFYKALSSIAGEPAQTLYGYLPAELVSVTSQYFLLQADFRLDELHLAYASVMYRQGSHSIQVLSRTVTPIPPMDDPGNTDSPRPDPCQFQEVTDQP